MLLSSISYELVIFKGILEFNRTKLFVCRGGRGPDQHEQTEHQERHDGPDPEARLNIRHQPEAPQQRGRGRGLQQSDLLRHIEVRI